MTEGNNYASAGEVAAWSRGLSEEFILCRDLGHLWRPLSARWSAEDSAYARTMRCGRCSTERHQLLSAGGHVLSGNYSYTEGYTAPKGQGRLGTEGRDSLRLESVLRLLGKDDGPDKPTKRKAT